MCDPSYSLGGGWGSLKVFLDPPSTHPCNLCVIPVIVYRRVGGGSEVFLDPPPTPGWGCLHTQFFTEIFSNLNTICRYVKSVPA